MLKFKLPKLEDLGLEVIKYDTMPEIGAYSFVNRELETELAKTKSKLDEPYKTKEGSFIMNMMDPFIYEKKNIAKKIGNFNISNAWLKCYEMIYGFNLIPVNFRKSDETKKFLHFDNAAFPGSFILAAHHYASTMTSLKYEWRGSSLFDEKEKNPTFLSDYYNLYKNYPENWLMHNSIQKSKTTGSLITLNNGDVCKPENIKDFEKIFDHNVDLYTSDLGFDVSSDYNKQEEFHQPANLGQIACGIAVCKSGGNFITKQYTYFKSMNIGIMVILAQAFRDFYVCKPITSKADNSETYLVGIGFDEKYRSPILEWCYRGLELSKEKKYDPNVKLLPESSKLFTDSMIKAINASSDIIFGKQIKSIEHNIQTFNTVSKMKLQKSELLEKIFDLEEYRKLISLYNSNVYFKKIDRKNRLNMYDKFRQMSK